VASVEQPISTTGEGAAAVAELHQIVARSAPLSSPIRVHRLRDVGRSSARLPECLLSDRTQIEDTVITDFGVHPALATDLIELLGPAGRAAYAAEQLESWTASDLTSAQGHRIARQ
jgi:coniferyl-aldehyde dehydrogenase